MARQLQTGPLGPGRLTSQGIQPMNRFFDRDRLPVPLITRLVIILLLWVLVYHVLVTFKTLFIPLVMGILFAFLLHPIADRFERLRVPRILANLIAIILGIGVVYGVMLFMQSQLSVLLEDLPALRTRASENINTMYSGLRAKLGLVTRDDARPPITTLVANAFNMGGDSMQDTMRGTANTVVAIGIMPVYVFMFLYYRDKYSRFIMMLVDDKDHRLTRRIIRRISTVTGKYMTGIFTVVLILCVVNSLGFYLIGLEYAILLGIIAAICNFIPYFGTIIGYLIALLFALMTGSADQAGLVVLQFALVQFTENNILTPNIVGNKVKINPFFVILAVITGGMVWGVAGMFVSVPLLGMVKVTCDVIPSLRPWSFLLGDRGTEAHALTASKIKRFFAFSKIAREEH
jgi:predicted PurR-regulated permease PerM